MDMDGTFAFALIHDSTKPLQFHAFHLQVTFETFGFLTEAIQKGYRIQT